VPLEVRAPQQMDEAVPGVARYQTELEPRGFQYRNFTLDARAQAVRVSVRVPYDGTGGKGLRLDPGRGNGIFFARMSTEGPPIDPVHHVGSLQGYERILDSNDLEREAMASYLPGTAFDRMWGLYWENRGQPEYETPYDEPAPDVPIHATLTLNHYAVSLVRNDAQVVLRNQLAQVQGRVEFLTGSLVSQSLTGSGRHGFASLSTRVKPGTEVWLFSIQANAVNLAAHVFALHCTEKEGCSVAKQAVLQKGRTTLSIDNPAAGEWRVAVLPDDEANYPSYEVKQIALRPVGDPGDFRNFPHAAIVKVPIPDAVIKNDVANTSIYAGFHIAPAGDSREGTLIALSFLGGEEL